ncbi:GAP family protein [Rhodococcus ruber]|uniref:GAP family protein n=1 Tax=Rhodococcus ruber TaxID=1830 RepID=A0ABT4MHD4_9NOCA|nr:GAP family protein [Rhodococcus ruber]MCZ4520386.1 GAP family protein [Rhodococcus ruber]
MVTLLLALVGFAILDSLDVLLIGVTAAIAVHSRTTRRSPFRAGLAFVGGVFTATTVFGILTVLGIDFVTDLFDFTITPTVRYRTELVVGSVLITLGMLRTAERRPPAWASRAGSSIPLVALTGLTIGLVQGPTAVPYLAGLTMLSTHAPRPQWWPAIVVVYCLIGLLPPILVLILASRKSRRSRRAFIATVRGLTRYGPPTVRVIFVVLGVASVADALIHARDLL